MITDWLCPGTGCTNMVASKHLCSDCRAYLPTVLADIEVLYLADARHPARQGAELAHTRTQVSAWAMALAAQVGATLPDGFNAAHALLTTRWQDWGETETLTNFYNAMFVARRRLSRAVNPGGSVQKLQTRCWRCGCATLAQHDGGEYVVCLTCNSRWGQAAYLAIIGQSGTQEGQSTDDNPMARVGDQ